ncbi:MAG: MFS transporter [Clostridia bacterium]|nr:MFS transporter [Clostridia bacterium]
MMTEAKKFKRTKLACYSAYLSSASIFSLPPLLFVTFREMYGISYTLLGTLVLVNFFTQLSIDLVFSFFSKYFNIEKTVRFTPLLTSLGLMLYAVLPVLFPQYAYAGLLLGTVVFSVAAGLGEVLLSPTIAAIPSEHPDRDMSFLHSLYGWGLVGVVVVSSVFLRVFGTHNWMYLTGILALLPLISFGLFCTSPMPQMNLSQNTAPDKVKRRNFGMALCIACIFLGSAAENTMTNWISGYMETALRIPKVVGDIAGMALFALLLGIVRSLYARYGRNISNVLLGGMVGATVCYLIAGFSTSAALSLTACVLVGMFTSMLWPGTLILMEEKFRAPGVVAYALMAAGGDCGASVAPQLMGIVVDTVSASAWANQLASTLSLSAEQIGMKTGMLVASLFPLLGIFLLLYMKKYFAKKIS